MKIRACVLAAATLLLVTAPAAFAEKAWENEEAYKRLLRGEAKTLKPLLQAAVKDDYRRQAWYLADRIIAANPDDQFAIEVLEKWSGDELMLGQPVKKAFTKKLQNTLKQIGDAYFNFGETLEGAGIDPIEYYPINVRAQAYGSVAGPLISSMKQGGYMWLGTYTHEEEKAVRAIMGEDLMPMIAFPPEWDDEYLKIRVQWPECKVVTIGTWRLITDHKYDMALKGARLLMDIEAWMIKRFGKGKPSDEMTTVVMFRDKAAYLKFGPGLVRQRHKDNLSADTGFYDDRYRRAILADVDSDNTFIGELQNLKGMAARALAKSRYSKGAGGRVTGRGEWLLQGMRGVGESLRYTDAEKGTMELAPEINWRLSVARAARDSEQLIAWPIFMELSEKKRLKQERLESLDIHVNGTKYTATSVDLVTAQATAFALAVVLSDKKKGPKGYAKLLEELYKRDSLADPWTVIRWKAKKVIEELNRVMDSVVVD